MTTRARRRKVIDCVDQMNIRLELACDPPCKIEGGKTFKQHFCFTLTGLEKGSPVSISFVNAGDSMCADDWEGYQCVYADGVATADPLGDGECWVRIKSTSFDGQILKVEHVPQSNSCTYAYFAPYTLDRHARLLASVATHSVPRCAVTTVGRVRESLAGAAEAGTSSLTLDGRQIDVVIVSSTPSTQNTIDDGTGRVESLSEYLKECDEPSECAHVSMNEVTLLPTPTEGTDGVCRPPHPINVLEFNQTKQKRSGRVQQCPTSTYSNPNSPYVLSTNSRHLPTSSAICSGVQNMCPSS